jgi:hypothetical protein
MTGRARDFKAERMAVRAAVAAGRVSPADGMAQIRALTDAEVVAMVRRDRQRVYRERHREKLRERNRRYYEGYYERNRAAVNASVRAYVERNRDEVNARRRERYRRTGR